MIDLTDYTRYRLYKGRVIDIVESTHLIEYAHCESCGHITHWSECRSYRVDVNFCRECNGIECIETVWIDDRDDSIIWSEKHECFINKGE